MEIKKGMYTVNISDKTLSFYLSEKKFFSVGASCSVNGVLSDFDSENICNDNL